MLTSAEAARCEQMSTNKQARLLIGPGWPRTQQARREEGLLRRLGLLVAVVGGRPAVPHSFERIVLPAHATAPKLTESSAVAAQKGPGSLTPA